MKLFKLLDIQYSRFTGAIKSYLAKTLDEHSANYSNNTVFGLLINVINGVVLNTMLYIEDALMEQNKYTAQRKKSIWGLASLTGYNPSTGKAAGLQAKLSFKASSNYSLNIILQNKTQFTCSQNGLTYNLILPQEAIILSIDKNNYDKYLYLVQGKYETQSFVSKGGKFYTINFKYNGNIDMDYVEVKVNNKLWSSAASVYDMDAMGEQYTIKTAYAGGVDLIFGNDVHGKSLKDGDVVTVNYLTHDGETGNISTDIKTYFIFNNPLKNIAAEDVDGNALFNVTLVSADTVASGSNSETTEQVKQMIGLNSRSLVLASPENYKQLINKFSFCGYNRTWSEPGSLVINSLIIKNYKSILSQGKSYLDLSPEDFKLTELLKKSIINSVNSTGNQLAGVTYNIIDPEICKYAMYLYIKTKGVQENNDFVKEQVRQIICDFFSKIETDNYISKSEIMFILKEKIPTIDGVSIYFLSEKNETALQSKQYNQVQYKYNPITGNYEKIIIKKTLQTGENPNLGLDDHGNISLDSYSQYPVLMGGWDFLNQKGQEVKVLDPISITFE